MIILDTNVVSEAFRAAPSTVVRTWLDAQTTTDLFLCTPVLAELRYGIERLPASARRENLELLLSNVESELFDNRILPFDRASACEFGRLQAQRAGIGRPMATMDALIAAIAISHHMAVATRDVVDFASLGLDLINPFEPAAAR
jgi:predicted nucleic acid-binding protein